MQNYLLMYQMTDVLLVQLSIIEVFHVNCFKLFLHEKSIVVDINDLLCSVIVWTPLCAMLCYLYHLITSCQILQ